MTGTLDVFFSYHTVDHATVTQVAQHLHDRGIRVFLDTAGISTAGISTTAAVAAGAGVGDRVLRRSRRLRKSSARGRSG